MTAEVDLKRQELEREALAKAFARYPAGFLRKNLKTVYVVRTMTQNGAGYGGTTGDDGDSVLLTVGEDENPDGAWLQTVFHHETAHLLMDKHGKSFSKRAWAAATAPEFHYQHADEGGYGAILEGDDDNRFRVDLNSQGLLNAYGASCFDEDWAIFAQYVVAPTPEFTAAVAKFPFVAKRAALVESFYEKVCPGWTASPFATPANGVEPSERPRR